MFNITLSVLELKFCENIVVSLACADTVDDCLFSYTALSSKQMRKISVFANVAKFTKLYLKFGMSCANLVS